MTAPEGMDKYQYDVLKGQSAELLRNSTLRVIVPAIEPPYVNYANFSKDLRTRYGYGPGVVMEILMEVGDQLQLTYEVVPIKRTVPENETWREAFRALCSKEADILAGAAIMGYDRSLMSDLTYPFYFDRTGMLIVSSEQDRGSGMFIVTEPFHWQVWMLCVVCIVVSAATLHLMSRTLNRVHDEESLSLFGSAWVFFSIFVHQGISEQPQSWSIRLIMSFWWLASITLMATFTGSLVALFAVNKVALPFHNIEQLAKLVKQGRYTVLMDGSSVTRTNMIAKSQIPVYKELAHEILVNHRVKYVEGIDKAVDFLVNNAGYVLLGPMTVLDIYAQKDCRFALISSDMLSTYFTIPFTKNSPYSAYFSAKIQELVERGFMQKWIRDYKGYVSLQRYHCNATAQSNKGYLDFHRAQGAFWILAGGVLGGIAVLLLESTVKRLMRRPVSGDGSVAQRGWRLLFFRSSEDP